MSSWMQRMTRLGGLGLMTIVPIADRQCWAFQVVGATFEPQVDENTSATPPSLPIPKHPGRVPESPENSLPKASQPNREQRKTVPVSQRSSAARLPIPGQPSRNLTPLDQLDEEVELEEGETAEEAAEGGGLLKFFPHEFRDGGITIEAIYTGETFTKARGGINSSRATNYRSNLDLVGIVDTAKMGWWERGRFFVYGQNLSGKPISTSDVGDIQLFSNLDSTISATERPQFTTIAEYWYEHLVVDELWRIKVGKQDANADFAFTDLGGDFVNSSFGLPPMIPLPTFPSQALGIASFLNLTDETILALGIYDGTLPSGPQGVRWGFDTLGDNGAISLYQIEHKPQLGTDGEFPSTIRLGGWFHSSNDSWSEFDDAIAPRTFGHNYGYFASVDQLIWKEHLGTDDDQGLGIFFQFGWAPSNRNVIREYYGGGLVYKGLLPNRDDDLLGLAFASALLSEHFRASSDMVGLSPAPSETAVELFYKTLLGPNMSVQPDIQYIANPSGIHRDALVPGMRFEVVF